MGKQREKEMPKESKSQAMAQFLENESSTLFLELIKSADKWAVEST